MLNYVNTTVSHQLLLLVCFSLLLHRQFHFLYPFLCFLLKHIYSSLYVLSNIHHFAFLLLILRLFYLYMYFLFLPLSYQKVLLAFYFFLLLYLEKFDRGISAAFVPCRFEYWNICTLYNLISFNKLYVSSNSSSVSSGKPNYYICCKYSIFKVISYVFYDFYYIFFSGIFYSFFLMFLYIHFGVINGNVGKFFPIFLVLI